MFGVGWLLRVRQYVACRSLWYDECKLANSVISAPLYNLRTSGTPEGFLFVTKLAVSLLGTHEWVLRLAPLLAGLLALPLVYIVAREAFGRRCARLALCLLAFSPVLIRYGDDFKQYSVDLLVALLLYWAVFFPIQRVERISPTRFVSGCVLGGLAIWFSHPSLFVLAGIGFALFGQAIARKNARKVAQLLLIGGFWIASFTACYLISLAAPAARDNLVSYWAGRDAFMPLLPRSLSQLRWFGHAAAGMFAEAGGFSLGYPVALAAFAAGAIWVYHRGKKTTLLALVGPILFALLASGLHKYPFKGRLLTFTVPCMALLTALGVYAICTQSRTRAARAMGYLLAMCILAHPGYMCAKRFIAPRLKEEIKPVLQYVVDHYRQGDRLYVYYGAGPAVEYYWPGYFPAPGDYILGVRAREYPEEYGRDIRKLNSSGRTWIIFSHLYRNERALFLHNLDRMGCKVRDVQAYGASAYLYEL